MKELPKLTDRQYQVLQLVQRAIARKGAPPTRAEIAAELGFRSANAAEEHLRALARKGVIELLGGTSRGIRLKGSARISSAPGLPDAASTTPQLTLPLVGRVAAGSPILAQEHVTATYAVTAELFSERPDYLLLVRGMSMQGAGILDGDLLAVRGTQEAQPGQIVVARLGDEVTVKRLRRNRGRVVLHAENPAFDDIIVRPGEPFAIEGRAVGLVRPGLPG